MEMHGTQPRHQHRIYIKTTRESMTSTSIVQEERLLEVFIAHHWTDSG